MENGFASAKRQDKGAEMKNRPVICMRSMQMAGAGWKGWQNPAMTLTWVRLSLKPGISASALTLA